MKIESIGQSRLPESGKRWEKRNKLAAEVAKNGQEEIRVIDLQDKFTVEGLLPKSSGY